MAWLAPANEVQNEAAAVTVSLHHETIGQGEPLVLLHGLFGSGRNWQGVARRFAEDYCVVLPDLRNHGHSPHTQTMSYQAMAADVTALIDELSVGPCLLVGHSMGGKVAMQLALDRPDQVRQLVVLDIAPVTYQTRHQGIFQALTGLPLDKIGSRQEADQWMAPWVPENGIRQFLLTNLIAADAGYHWRIPVATLEVAYEEISSFPSVNGQYKGPTLFMGGGRSDYLQEHHHADIMNLFPQASFSTIADAGHWIHAEQPQLFVDALRSFFDRD